IDNLERRGLSGSVAKAGEPQTLGCGLHAEVERFELAARGDCLGVELIELRDELALGGAQREAGGLLKDLALLDLMLGREPVPHWNIERGTCRVAEIVEAFGCLRCKLGRIDAV